MRLYFSELSNYIHNKQDGETFGLYVHFPFCYARCPYCHFYSLSYEEGRKKIWLRTLEKEIQQAARAVSGQGMVDTLYFGGGTPSLVSPEEIAEIIACLKLNFNLELREVTLECNPEAPAGWLKGWKEAGVTRLSLGLQSLDDKVLRILGRRHSAEAGWKLLEKAREAKFHSLNLDFMTGLPGETEATLEASLKAIREFKPQHVSVYLLEEIESVPFRAIWEKNPVPEEKIVESFESYRVGLKELGYEHYEISNYALSGFACKHNLKYWLYQPFIGLGPSAASHLGRVRWQNISDFKKWREAVEQGFWELEEFLVLDREQMLKEKIAFGLRLRAGLDWRQLRAEFSDLDLSPYEHKISELVRDGRLRFTDHRLCLPEENFLLSNAIISSLIF